MLFAQVIVDVISRNVDNVFDYIVPPFLYDEIKVGMRVSIPFGRQTRVGFVIKVSNESSAATKEIIDIVDDVVLIDDERKLYIDYLLSHPGSITSSAFKTVLPASILHKYERAVILLDEKDIDNDYILNKLIDKSPWMITKKDYEKYRNVLSRLEKKGCLKVSVSLKPRTTSKEQIALKLNNNYDVNLTQRESDVVDYLSNRRSILLTELKDFASPSVINNLVVKKVVSKIKKRVSRINPLYVNDKPLKLINEEVNKIDNKINNSKVDEIILTVGKYSDRIDYIVRQIQENIRKDKKTLILLPEIYGIIPLINDITKYFSEIKILPFHSELSNGVIYDIYDYITNDDELDVLVGTRLSAFLPIQNIGSIVCLDSHDQNYLQTQQTHFDTLEVLSIKRKYHKTKLIYLSYVQPLRLIKKYEDNKNNYIKIEYENNKSIANVKIEDMREEIKKGNLTIFSNDLKTSIEESIKSGKQAMLLMNRRGYASFVLCRGCGKIVTDPIDDLPMIYYKQGNELRARHNKHVEEFSKTCRQCGQDLVRPVSAGVEQLREVTKKTFPQARVLYLDAEKIKSTDNFLNKIDEFSDGKYDIIIGTTFINKTFSAKNLNVIGILMIDQMLNLPFFDTYEKTYHYLKQTLQHDFIHKPEVYIQTYNPENKILNWFSQNNDEKYYKDQLNTRKFAKLPPYNHMVQIVFGMDSYLKTYQKAFQFKEEISEYVIEVLGPLPSYRLIEDKNYRFILTIKYNTWKNELNNILNKYSKDVLIQVDNENNLL